MLSSLRQTEILSSSAHAIAAGKSAALSQTGETQPRVCFPSVFFFFYPVVSFFFSFHLHRFLI